MDGFFWLEGLTNFSTLEGTENFCGAEGPNNLAILDSTDRFSRLPGPAVGDLDSVNDILDDVDALVMSSFLTLKIQEIWSMTI